MKNIEKIRKEIEQIEVPEEQDYWTVVVEDKQKGKRVGTSFHLSKILKEEAIDFKEICGWELNRAISKIEEFKKK